MNKLKLILLCLTSVLFVFSMGKVNVHAKGISKQSIAPILNMQHDIISNGQLKSTINSAEATTYKIIKDKALKIDQSKPRISALNSNLVINKDSVLTNETPNELYFFSPQSNKALFSRMLSDNINYRLQLYVVDWNEGVAYPTDLIKKPGELLYFSNLPAGDYALQVRSEGSVGNQYTIQLNVANPANLTTILADSGNLAYIVASYDDGSVYVNGEFAFNLSGNNLEWKREFNLSLPGGYSTRTHNLSDIKVAGVSSPVYYASSYGSSPKALLIYLDKGTLFTYHESQYQSGTPPYYYSSFVDTLGKKTPRRLDEDDNNYGSHILAFDLNTGKSIDFFSTLNFYYAAGIEKLPSITILR